MTKKKQDNTVEKIASREIPLSRYEARLVNGSVQYYAIATDGAEYLMPDCYRNMYTDDYLAIMERTVRIPDLFFTVQTHYIPLFTGAEN